MATHWLNLILFLFPWTIIYGTYAQQNIWYYPMNASDSDWVIQSGSYTAVTANADCPDALTECWQLGGDVDNVITLNTSTLSWTLIELGYKINTVALSHSETCLIEYSIDNTNFYDIQRVQGTDIEPQNHIKTTWTPSIRSQSLFIIRLSSLNKQNGFDCYFAQFRLSGSSITMTADPTEHPTTSTSTPSNAPSAAPSLAPSSAPSQSPLPIPTKGPTDVPSRMPSQTPSASPVPAPTAPPTTAPSSSPTWNPSAVPSSAPSASPTPQPTKHPSKVPTNVPSHTPSAQPSRIPTQSPTFLPTYPTLDPTNAPSSSPTDTPSQSPTESPTGAPTIAPTASPTAAPSVAPTLSPTLAPSRSPSAAPTPAPSRDPTPAPSESPTPSPTFYPTVTPTTRTLPALHLNQYGIDVLDIWSLVDIQSKARWRKLLMLAASDSFSNTPISDTIYADVFMEPKFEVDLTFDCDVLSSSIECAPRDVKRIQYEFGDLFGLKYLESTAITCVSTSIAITISLGEYDITQSIASVAASPTAVAAMERILGDISGITAVSYVDSTHHTRLEAVVLSWESSAYDSTDFEYDMSVNEDAFKANIATRINVNGFHVVDVEFINTEKGLLPIETIPDNILCDSDRDFTAFPKFTSKLVGTGNVVQIDFDRPTNLGNDAGNKNLADVVVNYISSSLNYSVASWQDPSTLLLFIGYGPATITAQSQYFIKDCVRDACYPKDTLCSDQQHNTSEAIDSDYTQVMESRITGATYFSSTCPLLLSGAMSIGPLGVFKEQAQHREYPLYSWSIFKESTLILSKSDQINPILSADNNGLYSTGDILVASLTTRWAKGSTTNTNITLQIAADSTSPAVIVDGGLIHHAQYEVGEHVVFSMSYSLCGSITDDNDVNIIWKEVRPSEAQSSPHGIRYSSKSIPSSIESEVMIAANVTDLVLPMDALSPYHVYYYKVSVGSSAQYIELEVMPPLVLNTGGQSKTTISIQADTFLSIRHLFVFPEYLEDDELSAYYSWSWYCVEQHANVECEDEFVPLDNVMDILIENRLLRGNEVYFYTVTLNDFTYETSTSSSYLVYTGSMQHAQIAIADASNRNINPLFEELMTSIDVISSSESVSNFLSQQWIAPSYNFGCGDDALSSYGSWFSLNAMNAETCNLPYGSVHKIRYEAITSESDELNSRWANVASVEFNMHINIPPFGGKCESNLYSGYSLTTAFSIECINWMYTHTADIDYYHKTSTTSYLRYALRLVAPHHVAECKTIHALLEGNTRDFATYSDVESTCIGMVLSYDKYSATIDEIYLGTGSHLLIAQIEDRISGAKASFVLRRIVVSDALSLNTDTINVWFHRHNSQRVFSFIMSLSYSLNSDNVASTFMDGVRLLPHWDDTATKYSTNLRSIASQFYQELKMMNMVTPKVVTQYLDTLYCIAMIHLKAESEDMSVINEWSDIIDVVYVDLIEFHKNDNIEYETTLKALEIVQLLLKKLMHLAPDDSYINTFYSLLKQANRVAYNSLYDAIPSQYATFVLPNMSMAITKTTRNELSRCNDLTMDIKWPSDWDQPQNTSATYVTCIVTSINMNISSSIGAVTDNILTLSIIDDDSSTRYSLAPIQLSTDGISEQSAESNEEHHCNSISFKTSSHAVFTSNFTVTQNYFTPNCVSADIYSGDTELNWNDANCQVVTYNEEEVQCACSSVRGTLFTLQYNEYELRSEFNTVTDVKGFTGTNLAKHPTAFIIMLLLFLLYALAFYCIQIRVNKKTHIPLLARQDIVIRESRDELFTQSSLGKLLSVLYAAHVSMAFKVKRSFAISIRDYHLLVSIFWSNPYTNIATIMRLTIFATYIVSVLWLSASFYGTNDQAHWAAALCVNPHTESSYCSDVAMAFVYSLFACVPAYFFLGWIALIRPYTVHWDDASMDSILTRVKERAPLWEMNTILNVAKAIYDEAQDIRSKVFFSGKAKEHHLGLALVEDEEYVDPKERVKLNPDDPQNVWSGAVSQNRAVPMAKLDTFRANVGNAANDLQNMEFDILNDMMNPSQISMNAPKPMYNPHPSSAAVHSLHAKETFPKLLSDSKSGSNDSNQPFIPPMDVVIPPVFGDIDAAKEDHHGGDADADDEDEKDILLGITPGDLHTDEWHNWQPVTDQEKDLQAEIAALLMDKSGIDMSRAMEKGRRKIIEMKKNNEALQVPESLLQRVESLDDGGIGPAAQSAARQKAKQKRKKEKLEQQQIIMNNNNNNQVAFDDDDDAYQMQAKIMAQIQAQQIPKVNNVEQALPPEPQSIEKKPKIVVSVVEVEDVAANDALDEEENAKNKEKMEKMEDVACQLRESELTRRRLLFTEYPFPRNCMKCCVVTLIFYCCVISCLTIYYGLSFGSNEFIVDLRFNPIMDDEVASSSRRLLQSEHHWDNIHWNETLYAETGECEFVPIYIRIQNALEHLMNNEHIFVSDAAYYKTSASMAEDMRWILFSFVALLIGLFIWQPLIAFIIGAIWLFQPQYNGQIVMNMLCCNLIYVYKSILCRQFLYLFCNRQYVEHHVIDSLILVIDDKKGNEHRLQKRQRYYISLDINGDIIDYGHEFNKIFKEWEFKNKGHHKSASSDFAQKMHRSYQSNDTYLDQNDHDEQFDNGNISDEDEWPKFEDEDIDNRNRKPSRFGFKNKGKKKRISGPPPVHRLKSDIEIAYEHDAHEDDVYEARPSGLGRRSTGAQAPVLSFGVHSGDMSVLHLFAIEHGIAGQANIGASSPADSSSPQYRYSTKDYSNVASIDVVKHSKKQSFFYMVEAEYFPSTYLNVNCNDILKYCPLHPIKQSLFGQQQNQQLQEPAPPPAPAAVAAEEIKNIDEEEQIRVAIQQSMMEQQHNDPQNAAVEMMPVAAAAVAVDPADDPSLQHLDPRQKRKIIKQRLKAQEELAFQESIKHLSEYERQQAIYERIQAKNKRKQDKQKRRQEMLNDPSADQVAQQHAILAQIEAAKTKQSASVQQAPMAFLYDS